MQNKNVCNGIRNKRTLSKKYIHPDVNDDLLTGAQNAADGHRIPAPRILNCCVPAR